MDLRAFGLSPFRHESRGRTDALTMHVIGARFERASLARAALAALRERFDLGPGAAGVRPLGSTDYAAPTEQHLLAGRFDDHAVAEVLATIRGRGGVIVELRSEEAPAVTVVGPPEPMSATDLPLGVRSPNGRATSRAARRASPGNPPFRSPRAPRARPPRPRRVGR